MSVSPRVWCCDHEIEVRESEPDRIRKRVSPLASYADHGIETRRQFFHCALPEKADSSRKCGRRRATRRDDFRECARSARVWFANFGAAKILMKELDPLKPFFYEEIINAQNVDVMAELAKATHIPIATGERIFTKWGFQEILDKKAAMILQPDVCYAGGITELKIIAGMAEAYYLPIAPHNPQGPCSLAASLQIGASVPNFLIQERGDNEYKDLLAKPLPPVKNGHRPLLTDPGLGITINEEALKAQQGDPKNYLNMYQTRYDPDDGSVIDW